MPPAENRAALERAVAAFNRQDDSYFEIYAPTVKLHGYPPPIDGLDGAQSFYKALWAAFPDIELKLDDVIGEGEKLAVRFSFTGTHQAEILGVPATGNRVEVTGQAVFLFDQGKVIERWQAMDDIGLMTQLGAIPAPA